MSCDNAHRRIANGLGTTAFGFSFYASLNTLIEQLTQVYAGECLQHAARIGESAPFQRLQFLSPSSDGEQPCAFWVQFNDQLLDRSREAAYTSPPPRQIQVAAVGAGAHWLVR